MDPLLFGALKGGHPLTHLVTVYLPGYTIRWLLGGGFVTWNDETYEAKDPTYGVLSSIGELTDGVDDDASPVEMVIIPASLASLAELSAIDAQGGKVTIHLGAVDRETGLLIGEPYRVHIGYLDSPEYRIADRTLAYDILSAEALALEPNDEQRQSDAFHQYVWPGERAYEHQTDGTKQVYFRDDDPNNAIGYRSSRKKKGGDPKEFNYDPDAAWAFPFGRTEVRGVLNYRVGFGPTNRYNSLMVTTAASGPIKGYVSIAVNDEPTTFGANDVALDGEHDGALWVQTKVGTQPQTALTFPTGLNFGGQPPAGWGSAYAQSGKAVFMATLFENSKKSEWQGGVPTFLLVQEGLLGWDPADTDSLITAPDTWAYIETGPAASLNWSIGRWEGASTGGGYGVPYLSKIVGGYGAPLEAIDVDAHVAAHNIAVGYGWKVSDVPTSADDKHTVRKRLLQSAGCEPATICGMISLVCSAAPLTSVLTATNEDTTGSLTVSLQASRLERRNVSLPKFKSEAHRWEMTQIGAVGDPDWITQDGGRRAKGPSFPTVADKDQCAALAYLDLAHDRAAFMEAPMRPYMLAVEPGQAFTWDEPEFLLVNVKVQVRKRVYDPMKGEVRMTARAERDANYTEALAQVGVAPPASGAYVPPPIFVEPPSALEITATAGVAHLSYRNPTADSNFFAVVLYRALGSSNFADAIAIGDPYSGGLGATMTMDDTPGSGGQWFYWVASVHEDMASSVPIGPVSVQLGLDMNFAAGSYSLDGVSQSTPAGLAGWSYARTDSPAGTATKRTVAGIFSAVANNVAPITDRGLVLEASTVNLAPQSWNTADASWTVSAATLTPGQADPMGGTGAALITATGGSASHRALLPSVSFVAGTIYTLAALVKAGTTDRVQMTGFGSAFAGAGYANFYLNGAGSVTATGGTITASGVTSVGAGWYLIWIAVTASGTISASGAIITHLLTGSEARVPSVSTSGTFYVVGAQVETASAPSSSVVSTTSTASRGLPAVTLTVPAGVATYTATYNGGATATGSVSPGAAFDLVTGRPWFGGRLERLRMS